MRDLPFGFIELLRGRKIDFVENNQISEGDLLAGFGGLSEAGRYVLGIDYRYHARKREMAPYPLVGVNALRDRRRLGEPRGFDHHGVELVAMLQQLKEAAHEIPAYGTADAAVTHLDHLLVGRQQQVVIDSDLAERHADIVIAESCLVDGDGFELVRRMRLLAAYRFTPVLLLRSRLQMFDSARARLAREVTLLAKPVRRADLESIVRDCLRSNAVLDDIAELLSPG